VEVRELEQDPAQRQQIGLRVPVRRMAGDVIRPESLLEDQRRHLEHRSSWEPVARSWTAEANEAQLDDTIQALRMCRIS